MRYYTLLDKKWLNYYISGSKCAFFVFSAISIVLATLAFFNPFVIYLCFISLFVALLFLLTYFAHRKKYGRKVLIKEKMLEVCNAQQKLIYTLSLTEVMHIQQAILFSGPRSIGFTQENCLVIYRIGADVYENMEYRSYWNDKDILIVQNPKLITTLTHMLE